MEICSGYSRRTLLVGPWAIKFPRAPECNGRGFWFGLYKGALHNLRERNLWQQTHHPSLCPVVWSSSTGLVCVMRRAVQPAGYTQEYLDATVERGAWPATDWPFLEPADLHVANVGFIDGELVLLDYGS